MHLISRLLASTGWLWLPGLVSVRLAARGESFNWYEGVSGSFDDPNRWQVGFNIPPKQNPEGKIPGPSDRVGLTRGDALPVSYEVRIAGGAVDSFAVGSFGLPALTQPLTLNLSGTMTVRWLELNNKIRLVGGGELVGNGPDSLLNDVSVLGGTTLRLSGGAKGAGLVIDNAKGVFQDVSLNAADLGDAVVLRAGEVNSSGPIRFGGLTRMEAGSTWKHQGDGLVRGRFALTGGSTFTAAGAVDLSHLTLEGQSSFQAEDILHSGFGFFTLKEASAIRAGSLRVNAGAVEFLPSEISGASTLDVTIFELAQGFLRLASGAKLRTSTSSMGTTGSAGITVTGEGSEWAEQDHLIGGNVRVLDRGLVTFGSTAQDITARVEGSGSKLQFKRVYGRSRMLVSGGAEVSGEDFSATDGGGYSDGKGSSLRLTGEFSLGFEGQGLNQFSVLGGGGVVCETAELTSAENGSTTMTVTGAESSWLIHEELSLGQGSDARATLEISRGGKVTVGTDFVPSMKKVSIGGGSAVRVLDEASVFDTAFVGTTLVGAEPGLARGRSVLSIAGGASARVHRLEIAPDSVSDGFVSVQGPASRLIASAPVVIGIDGGKGAMEVREGAKVIAASVEVGNSGAENTLLISGSGSSLSVEDGIFVGDDFSRGTMTLANGARLLANGKSPLRSLGLGVGEFSQGTLVVDGQGTLVDLPEDRLTVGFSGAGKLTVSGGAEVKVDECVLGFATGASASVLVTGVEQADRLSSLFVFERLEVGGQPSSAPATLDVATGGRVSVGDQMRVGAKGVVQLSAGGIVVGFGAPIPEALLVSSGGTLTLDPGARLNLGSGRLIVRGGTFVPAAGPAPGGGNALPGTPSLHARASGGAPPRLAANPTAATRIEGALSVEEGGAMRMILASSNAPGTGPIRVTGPVSLSGKLVIECIESFAPVAGQRFEFLAASAGISGDFAQVEVLGLAPGFRYELKSDSAGVYALTALSDGTATSNPRLSFVRAGGELKLSWPETAVGFVLQTANAPAGTIWSTIPSDFNRASVPLTAPAGFFRLTRP